MIALICSAELRADLRWDALVVEQPARVGEGVIQFSFTFFNPEDHPITIVAKPDCGCTVVTLQKKSYGPGEKGRLHAQMDVKGMTGLLEKKIEIYTNESWRPTVLTMRTNVPAWLEISPRLLQWSMGESESAKEAVISLNKTARIQLALQATDSSDVEASLKPEPDGRHYRLTVRPRSTKDPMQARINLIATTPGADPRTFLVFALVR